MKILRNNDKFMQLYNAIRRDKSFFSIYSFAYELNELCEKQQAKERKSIRYRLDYTCPSHHSKTPYIWMC